jgi:hypothetical protein
MSAVISLWLWLLLLNMFHAGMPLLSQKQQLFDVSPTVQLQISLHFAQWVKMFHGFLLSYSRLFAFFDMFHPECNCTVVF